MDPKNIFIEILDENDDLIMVLDEKWKAKYFDRSKDYKRIYNGRHKYLIVEDSLTGRFQGYNLKIKGTFDPKKLTVIVKNVGGKMKLITGVRYAGRVLKVDDFGDFRGKGMYYHLI